MNNKKLGFTFIEVMIVIAVFSIGVLAVLRMVIHNMSAMDSINTRTTATFLAKEGISLVYSLRDSNRLAGLPRDCVINLDYDEESLNPKVCSDYLISGNNNIWEIGLGDNGFFLNPTTTGEAKLYLNIGNDGLEYYSYEDSGKETIFSRYILFTGILENNKILPKDKIVKVESHILYNKGNTVGHVVLESFIGNY